jgi:hypothetical protein
MISRMSARAASPIGSFGFASNRRTSSSDAWVPSILDDSTASCVRSGESRSRGFGIAWRMPSYRARARFADAIRGI